MNLLEVIAVVYAITIINIILFGLVLRSEVNKKIKEKK
jgi:glycopeptide antibiotics resistance protein